MSVRLRSTLPPSVVTSSCCRNQGNRRTSDERIQGEVLLWRRGIHRERGAGGDGLLSLRVLPPLVGGSGERLYAVAAHGAHGDPGRGQHRYLQQDPRQLPQVVQDLLRPRVHRAPAAAAHGRVCGDASATQVPAGAARQLPGGGAAGQGRTAEDEGLPEGVRRLGRDAPGVSRTAASSKSAVIATRYAGALWGCGSSSRSCSISASSESIGAEQVLPRQR